MASDDVHTIDLSNRYLTEIPEEVLKKCEISSLNLNGNPGIRLRGCLGRFTQLKELLLSFCALVEIPEAIRELPQLEKLSLAGNSQLKHLNSSIAELRSLRELDVSCCDFREFSVAGFDLINLEKLSLAGNSQLKHLNSSIAELRSLRELDVRYCGFREFSVAGCDLKSLEKLNLASNKNLNHIDPSIGNLPSLVALDLSQCELREIPATICNLQKLNELEIEGCKNLQQLCLSFGKLRSLKSLRVSECGLQSLPDSFGELENLNELEIEGCENLQQLCLSFGKLRSLKSLRVSECGLQSLPDSFGELENLNELEIVFCKDLQHLCLSFGKLRSLKSLTIRNCGLQSLPDSFGELENLNELEIEGCENLQQLCLSFGKLRSLKSLRVSECGLQSLPDSFGELENLLTLNVSSNRFKEFPECTLQLSSLEVLDLSNISVIGNVITQLPEELANTRLKELDLFGNPITFPPEGIWMQGVPAIKLYMKAIREARQKMHVDTINIIGDTGAGKTSIAMSLVEGQPRTALDDDRTKVIDQFRLYNPAGDSTCINDFGGHPAYHSIIPIFLVSNGLVIIAYNLQDEDKEKCVRKWLLTAIARLTRICIIIAGTRADCEVNRLAIEERMNQHVRDIKNDLMETVKLHIGDASCYSEGQNPTHNKRLIKLNELLLNLENAKIDVTTVSCKSGSGLKELQELVAGRRRLSEVLPAPWISVMKDILDYRRPGLSYLTMDDVKTIYDKYVKDNNYKVLRTILIYLVGSSQIIWLENDFDQHQNDTIFNLSYRIAELCKKNDSSLNGVVFNSPREIVELCKKILHHDQHPGVPREYEKEYKDGIMYQQLLHRLLLEEHRSIDLRLPLPKERHSMIVYILQYFNLVCKIPPTKGAQSNKTKFVIPSKLTDKEPGDLQLVENHLRDCEAKVRFSLSFINNVVPESFFETCLAIILKMNEWFDLEPDVEVWKNGLYLCHNGVYLIVKHRNEEVVVTTGSSFASSFWSLLRPILEWLFKYITDSWPGVPPTCLFVCPCMSTERSGDASRRRIALEEYYLQRTGERSSSSEKQHCPQCKIQVPRSLLFPVETDSFSSEEQSEIKDFYAKLLQMFPLCPILRQRASDVTLPVVPQTSVAKRIWDENPNRHDSSKRRKMNTPTGRRSSTESAVAKRLRNAGEFISGRLTYQATSDIAWHLCSEGHILYADKEHVERDRVPKDAAKRLISVLEKASDKVIVAFAEKLKEMNLDELANRLLPKTAGHEPSQCPHP